MSKELCSNCNEPGEHYVVGYGFNSGFWTCSKYYGADGRRLPEYIDDHPFNTAIAMSILTSIK